jgi:isopentenyl-diphosphate delta-isomerase
MQEHVVLLSDDGRAIGSAPKAAVHRADTPLHLAFSCYAFSRQGRFLLSQRSLSKRTWPGTWTNTCCGHPLPGEDMYRSVARRLSDELGLVALQVDLILPTFRYQARMGNGITENELCPVFRAITDSSPAPAPDEVAATRWMSWASLSKVIAAGRFDVSPWCRDQVGELRRLGPDPLAWPAADPQALPAAARAALSGGR